LTGSNPSRNFSINFNGTGITPTAAAPAEVRFSYFKAFVANGWGGTNLHLVICRGSFDEYYTSAQRQQAMAGTCVHEPGHSFGLVYGLGWETSDASHSAHCTYKACVMWWQGYIGRPHDFHSKTLSNPGCHTYMSGLDMSKSAMESKWKFPR